jgi:hypothetical protein
LYQNQSIESINMDALGQLTPEQQQQVMQQAAMAANAQIMQEMMKQTISVCFKKCAGTSVRHQRLFEDC